MGAEVAIFIVCYDLKKIGQNYDCITEKLEKLPYCHAQGSVWFVDYSGDTSQLRTHLQPCLDENDILFVDLVSNKWAGVLMPTCGKWLNDRGL
jgi:hypothetical protein